MAIVWATVQGVTAPDAAELVVATLTVPNVTVQSQIVFLANILVTDADADATIVEVNIRRGTLTGALVSPVTGDGNNGVTQLGATETLGPFTDGPGIVGNAVYVLTATIDNASGPSTGLAATLLAIVN